MFGYSYLENMYVCFQILRFVQLSIIDDNGFIAIVNRANYQSFVDNKWQFDQLIAHFIYQMNSGNIVVWQTSNDGGGNWGVSFSEQPTGTDAYREFEHFINVTEGKLFLADYSDLTMAAQFSDEPIPAIHNADRIIELENGWYKFTVRQLFDPDNCLEYFDTETDRNVSFEVIFTPVKEPVRQKMTAVYWFEAAS